VEQITEEGDVEIDINARATELIQIFEAAGASNIFQKQDEYQTPSGVKGVTISGSFDWTTENKETVRKEYFVYYFAENSGLQQIEFVSNREDRYAKIIIDRLVDSFNFKTEVQ
jgi:MarR-like DNA-binding transcriptional regulator SgrR of sgrS sRNA